MIIYKIVNKPGYCKYISAVLLILFYSTVKAQNSLNVIKQPTQYLQKLTKDSLQRMQLLTDLISDLQYDLRYASTNNFVQKIMYPTNTNYTFLRLAPAKALDSVQQELKQKGYGLKIFDAYRPYAVSVAFWDLVKDERYVANPAKGSGHNRGIAIDLTIINKETGGAFDMGTDFDNFTDTAHHNFLQLPAAVLENRKLLKTTMEKYGFKALSTEWWHYSFPNTRDYDVLDLSFKELRKLAKKIK